MYNCNYLPAKAFRFHLTDFQLDTDFPSKFCVFTVKTPSVTQRLISPQNACEKSKNPLSFPSQNMSSNNSFTLIENNLSLFFFYLFSF